MEVVCIIKIRFIDGIYTDDEWGDFLIVEVVILNGFINDSRLFQFSCKVKKLTLVRSLIVIHHVPPKEMLHSKFDYRLILFLFDKI